MTVLQSPKPSGAAASGAEHVGRILKELTGLLETASATAEFLPAFLKVVAQATGAAGAAVWGRDQRGQFRLLHQDNFDALGADNNPAWHTVLLEETAARGRALWLPPRQNAAQSAGNLKANHSRFAVVLAPILVDKKVAGILEIFRGDEADRQVKRSIVRWTMDLAGFAAAWFHKQEWRHLQDQQQTSQGLDQFAVQLHQSLDPREVATFVANDGRHLLSCEQLAVGLRAGGSFQVAAVSGAVGVEARSPLVRAMAELMRCVAGWGETLIYQGKLDDDWPESVRGALNPYLAQSNSRWLIAQPLAQESEAPLAVLVAETFQPAGTPDLALERLEALRPHVTAALGNAWHVDRLPLRWLVRPLARLRDSFGGPGSWRWALFATVCAALACFLTFVQLPVRPEATGQLVPTERRIVYAPLNGKILDLLVNQGDVVEQGQELLFLEDPETQLKADQLSVRIQSFNQKLGLVEDQFTRNLSAKEQADLLAERLKVQFELRKAMVERDILLKDIRTPRKAPIVAPLGGQVLTFDAREKLVGKTVKLGEPLLRIGVVRGGWEVELFIPQREVGLVRAALARAPEGELDVDMLLTSDPHRSYRGKVRAESLGGETVIRDNRVVLPMRIAVTDPSLLGQMDQMPVGVEVRARIHCGAASAGTVWFGELWDFVYERFVF